jgi:hypothetical protein
LRALNEGARIVRAPPFNAPTAPFSASLKHPLLGKEWNYVFLTLITIACPTKKFSKKAFSAQ